jgi:hyperpolarization activated cyclic nucleotide-gated potassium channel 2
MAFFDDGKYPKWDIAEYVIDFFILIDIVLTFFTPVWVRHALKEKHSEIAKEYLSFWFWMDLFSIIPVAEIMFLLKVSSNVAKFSNVPKLYRLFKLSKLIRALRMQKKGDTYVGKLLRKFRKSDTILGNVLPLYAFGILIAYIFACIWFFIPRINPDKNSWLIRYRYDAESTHD